jgi:hypothetical protein
VLNVPTVRTVDVVVLGVEELEAMNDDASPGEGPARVPFFHTEAQGGRFDVTAELRLGHNVLLARPGPLPASRSDVAIRTVFHEPSSPRLSLDPPRVSDRQLTIRGRSEGRGVRLLVSALVGPAQGSGGLRREVFVDQVVDPSAEGTFELSIPWDPAEIGRAHV